MDASTTPIDWRTALTEQRRSMAWLADQTGKSRRTVYAYSRRDLVPPKEWLDLVSRILEVEVAA